MTGPVQEIVHGILTVHVIHMTGLHGIHTIVHLANLTMTEDVMIVVFETVTENATGVLKNVVHPPVMREPEIQKSRDHVMQRNLPGIAMIHQKVVRAVKLLMKTAG